MMYPNEITERTDKKSSTNKRDSNIDSVLNIDSWNIGFSNLNSRRLWEINSVSRMPYDRNIS